MSDSDEQIKGLQGIPRENTDMHHFSNGAAPCVAKIATLAQVGQLTVRTGT